MKTSNLVLLVVGLFLLPVIGLLVAVVGFFVAYAAVFRFDKLKETIGGWISLDYCKKI